MISEVLTTEQMAAADRATIAAGTPGYTLMTRAAQGVVDVIVERYPNMPVLVLCGPGNNGGDGFVIAQMLAEQGRAVDLACLVPVGQLKGDAAQAAGDWTGPVLSFADIKPKPGALVVDAVFGTGLVRRLDHEVSNIFNLLKDNPVIAVDIPSGVNGSTGAADPQTLRAAVTVTFHRKKLGHLLFPGAEYCGDVIVKEIGITVKTEYTALENSPELWRNILPRRQRSDHKYSHGHARIYGAPELTGATRLAAESCARAGAGLVTVLATKETASVYRETLAAHILVRDHLGWDDPRITANLWGPGGVPSAPDFKSPIPTVLDADALKDLPPKLAPHYILTPHEGEFARAFPDIKGSKVEKTQAAAKAIDAVVLLKGSDTVIAHPDGRCVINTHASPHLATAGTGDVLAGLITGLVAQGMDPFWAACAGSWVQGECGLRFGAGLVASDLPGMIPGILQEFA